MNKYRLLEIAYILIIVLVTGFVGFTFGAILGPIGIIFSAISGYLIGMAIRDAVVEVHTLANEERDARQDRQYFEYLDSLEEENQ